MLCRRLHIDTIYLVIYYGSMLTGDYLWPAIAEYLARVVQVDPLARVACYPKKLVFSMPEELVTGLGSDKRSEVKDNRVIAQSHPKPQDGFGGLSETVRKMTSVAPCRYFERPAQPKWGHPAQAAEAIPWLRVALRNQANIGRRIQQPFQLQSVVDACSRHT